MKKILLIASVFVAINSALAQRNLKYSGFFDSYYTKGPLKFSLEPGATYMVGDLRKTQIMPSIGIGANYRFWPPIYLNASLKYLFFGANDHDSKRAINYTGNAYQLNILGSYHFVYDFVRLQKDRRRGERKSNMYISTGLCINYYKASALNNDFSDASINGIRKFGIHVPIILGVPLRINPKWTIIPEIGYYYTFSDRLDGVDNRSVTNNNDVYGVFTLKFEYNPKGKIKKKMKFDSTNPGGGGGYSDSTKSPEYKRRMKEELERKKREEENYNPYDENIYEEPVNSEDEENNEDDGFLKEEDIIEEENNSDDDSGWD